MKKKILSMLLAVSSILSLSACENNPNGQNDSSVDCTKCEVGEKEMTLEDLNAMLNDSETMNMDLANAVAIVPFNHINGPRNEWKFYALINFVSKEKKYVKYQVTYLSCTCRTANVNYWQTAYIEINLPQSGQTANDVTLRKLSFDIDGSGHYHAGFWGDSDPICDEGTQQPVATYDNKEEYPELPSIKEDFIPLLIGKTKAQIDAYSTCDDMTEKIGDKLVRDAFAGASVSTNNIIRILQATFAYHAATYCA